MRKSVSGHMDIQGSRYKDTNSHHRNRQKNKNANKLSDIVNKIITSKTGADCAVGSDDDRSDLSGNENYNIYE